MARSSMVEPSAHNRLVAGSTPAGPTNFKHMYSQVEYMRDVLKLKYVDIAEMVGSSLNTCRVLYWKAKHLDKARYQRRTWLRENKDKQREIIKRWIKNNPKKIKEQSYRRKCKLCGVTPLPPKE